MDTARSGESPEMFLLFGVWGYILQDTGKEISQRDIKEEASSEWAKSAAGHELSLELNYPPDGL